MRPRTVILISFLVLVQFYGTWPLLPKVSAQTTIDFDDVSLVGILSSQLQARLGVDFYSGLPPNGQHGVEVLASSNARSPGQVARPLWNAGTHEFYRDPFVVMFSSPQSLVSMFVRYDGSPTPLRQISAKLEAWQGSTLVTSSSITFRTDESWQPLSVVLLGILGEPPPQSITAVSLSGGECSGSPFGTCEATIQPESNLLLIDDLYFEGAAPPPPVADMQAPQVTIISPQEATRVHFTSIDIEFQVTEDRDLSRVELTITHESGTITTHGNICGPLIADPGPCSPPTGFTRTISGGLSSAMEGKYTIKIDAYDAAGLHGQDSVNIILYVPVSGTSPSVGRLLILTVDWPDQTGRAYTPEDFRNKWVADLLDYFDKASNGHFRLDPYIVDQTIRLPSSRANYHSLGGGLHGGDCQANRDDPSQAARDNPFLHCINLSVGAVQAALSSRLISTLNVGASLPAIVPPGGGRNLAFGGVLVIAPQGSACVRVGGNTGQGSEYFPYVGQFNGHTYEMKVARLNEDDNCNGVMDRQDIGGAAHETGHIFGSMAHPANYDNPHELMDACSNPCYPSSFVRTAPDWFPDWLPSDKTATLNPPDGGSVVLAPTELLPTETTAKQAVFVKTATPNFYYIAECRRQLGWDAPKTPAGAFGIPSEGLLILQVTPGADPETQVMLPPGVIRDPSANGVDQATGHWYRLWRPEEVFTDPANDLQIRVGPDVGNGCTVTVDYGPGSATPVPDMVITPWLTPPMNTYETVDIWVDSSCNGYQQDDPTDPSRLLYGTRSDGTIVGNGDLPCVGHENRIYARVWNLGTAAATDVKVKFEVSEWSPSSEESLVLTSEVDENVFSALTSLAPNQDTQVYVVWTPAVAFTAPPGVGYAGITFSIRVTIEAVGGERLTFNNVALETASYFEIASPAEQQLTVINSSTEARNYHVSVLAPELPADWRLNVTSEPQTYNGAEHWLKPGETLKLRISVDAPETSAKGSMYFANLAVYYDKPVFDDAGNPVHIEQETAFGALLTLHKVSKITSSIQTNSATPVLGNVTIEILATIVLVAIVGIVIFAMNRRGAARKR